MSSVCMKNSRFFSGFAANYLKELVRVDFEVEKNCSVHILSVSQGHFMV